MTPSRADLYRDLQRRLFTPLRPAQDGAVVGAELEQLPFGVETGRRAPVTGAPRSTLAMLRDWAERQGATESESAKGTPVFTLAERGRITYEPGGQLEFSAVPHPSASGLLRAMETTLAPVAAVSLEHKIRLVSTGIDPVTPIDQVPLQFTCDRYRRMTDYFSAIGPAGVRMMRQTATLHVNVDLGDDPSLRWRLLNAVSPVLVAMFANSPRYEGRDTGYQSYRAETWRTLDWSRTGLVPSGHDPVADYLAFALEARAMFLGPVDGEYQSFAWWLSEERASLEDWHEHLTTLFPEVRPRGYFEVRSIDALPIEMLAAPLAFLVGLTSHRRTSRAALEVTGKPRTALLHVAGARGLRDSRLGRMARELIELALHGCRRLGPDVIANADLDAAEAFLRDVVTCYAKNCCLLFQEYLQNCMRRVVC